MFVIGYFILALAKMIGMISTIFYFILILRMIMSWVNPDPFNEFVRVIYLITDPILNPIRRLLPVQVGGIDFSPVVVFMLLYFVNYFVVNVLSRIGQGLL